MIRTILSKVLDELQKEKPDLSYIRGMVEVLLAANPSTAPFFSPDTHTFIAQSSSVVPVEKPTLLTVHSDPEAQIMDAKAAALLSTVQKGMSVE